MEEKKNIKFKSDQDLIRYIKECTNNSQDVEYKEIDIFNKKINIVFSQSVSDSNVISDFIVRSIKNSYNLKNIENIYNNISTNIVHKNKDDRLNYESGKNKSLIDKINERKKKLNDNNINEENIFDFEYIKNHISGSSIKELDYNTDDIFYYIFSGFTLVIIDLKILAIETKATLNRSISEPQNEMTLKGSKDSFNENYMLNIGLIRKRIKSEKLILNEKKVGRKTKTNVGILYISDIARKEEISYIEDKISGIDIDGILDSNYIVEIIEDSNKSDFPTTISTERPDNVSKYLLQGRIAIIVENSPFVVIAPAFLHDFLNSIEDNFQKYVNVGITRIIRYIALFVTIFTPGIYVALITFNQESIPTDLLLAFSTQRQGVPFPAYLEAFLMIIAFEILREGDYRIPNASGSTLSIVGALILGDAAVNAGIVSPIMIIVVAITTISGLMFNDINMSNALRTWRFIMLIFGSVAGVFGIGIGSVFLITKLCSTSSYTKPYLYPIAPFDFKFTLNNILKRENIATDTKRSIMLTDNLTKYKTR